jgi:predicted amidohydrolase
MPKRVRVAVCQPRAYFGEEEPKNVAAAKAYFDEAMRARPHLVVFPEGYPGPTHGPYDPELPGIRALQEKARAHGVFVSAGNVEPHPELPDVVSLTHKLIGPDGDIWANYRRVQPDEPPLNGYLLGGRMHVAPGDELAVVETPLGRIGLLICSELYVPELVRVLALMGAHIVIAPVNGGHTPRPFEATDTWNVIARARAAENILYVIQTQNIFMDGVRGAAIVAGPEGVVGKWEEEGVFVAEIDMERLLHLRRKLFDDDLLGAPRPGQAPYRCRPGQLYLRRPSLYRRLLEDDPEAFPYDYVYGDRSAWQRYYASLAERDAFLERVVRAADVAGAWREPTAQENEAS